MSKYAVYYLIMVVLVQELCRKLVIFVLGGGSLYNTTRNWRFREGIVFRESGKHTLMKIIVFMRVM